MRPVLVGCGRKLSSSSRGCRDTRVLPHCTMNMHGSRGIASAPLPFRVTHTHTHTEVAADRLLSDHFFITPPYGPNCEMPCCCRVAAAPWHSCRLSIVLFAGSCHIQPVSTSPREQHTHTHTATGMRQGHQRRWCHAARCRYAIFIYVCICV